MEIYTENITKFLNLAFIILCISVDPIYIMILKFFPISLIIPLLFGAFMGIMDTTIDWTI